MPPRPTQPRRSAGREGALVMWATDPHVWAGVALFGLSLLNFIVQTWR